MRNLLKHSLLFIIYGSISSIAAVIVVYVIQLHNRPDLYTWHLAELDEEFTESQSADIKSLADYQQLEQRLFDQLQARVNSQIKEKDRRLLNRYHTGSLADPEIYARNWNRTFELSLPEPRGGVLLIHGASDSPYSMRSLGEVFHSMGFWVVGLRLPGHGTAPSGLLNATWQDFAAATEIAANHVKTKVGKDKPFYIAGYSTGAALAVEYSLEILAGKNNPLPTGLILLSPAIGVPPYAKFAVWQSQLSKLAGLKKLAWNSIQPEFDPFKYNSFAVNAGDQVYKLTLEIAEGINGLDQGGGVKNFPKVLVFQSVVDATVTTPALINDLLNRLAPEGHELVLFDVNRYAEVEAVMISNPEATTDALINDGTLPFNLTLMTNTSDETNEVMVKHKLANSDQVSSEPLDLSWPNGIFSLSHLALPIPPDDPIYGSQAQADQPGLHLGKIEAFGERGLLLIPADYLIRLRYNPFFSYLKQRVEEFVKNEPNQVNQ
jgi:esterase/lipase